MERFVSDVESEKRTRSEAHKLINGKLDGLDGRMRWIELRIFAAFTVLVAAAWVIEHFGLLKK